jgi:dihydropteroate synthase
MLLNCRGKKLNLSSPQVMGILNITPNSFSTIGRFLSRDQALRHAENMLAEGAAMIDVGGEPTNPGVHPVVSLQEELDRVIPVIEALADAIAIPLSVDTSKPEVMRAAIAAGAGCINDVRALQDPLALQVVAEADMPVCLMHMAFPQGNPAGIPCLDMGEDIVSQVQYFLHARIAACLAAGIRSENILLDPGIGGGNFGKNAAQNIQLLSRLEDFTALGFPVLVGVSRKSFIGELLDLPVEERLSASLAAAALAVWQGASLIRAHDVKATVHAVKIAEACRSVKAAI